MLFVGHDNLRGVCAPWRRSKPGHTQIYPTLQHAVRTGAVGTQSQADVFGKWLSLTEDHIGVNSGGLRQMRPFNTLLWNTWREIPSI